MSRASGLSAQRTLCPPQHGVPQPLAAPILRPVSGALTRLGPHVSGAPWRLSLCMRHDALGVRAHVSAVGRRRDGQRRRAHACEARPAEAPVRGLSPAVVLDFSFSPWTNPWRRTLGPPVGRCPGRPASVRPRVLRFASTIFQGARGASRRFPAPGSLHPGDLGVGGRGRRIREARRPSRCALGGGMCSQGLPPPAMAPETGTPKVQPGCAALSTLYLASDVSALFPSYEQSASGWGRLQGVGGGVSSPVASTWLHTAPLQRPLRCPARQAEARGPRRREARRGRGAASRTLCHPLPCRGRVTRVPGVRGSGASLLEGSQRHQQTWPFSRLGSVSSDCAPEQRGHGLAGGGRPGGSRKAAPSGRLTFAGCGRYKPSSTTLLFVVRMLLQLLVLGSCRGQRDTRCSRYKFAASCDFLEDLGGLLLVSFSFIFVLLHVGKCGYIFLDGMKNVISRP